MHQQCSGQMKEPLVEEVLSLLRKPTPSHHPETLQNTVLTHPPIRIGAVDVNKNRTPNA